jgi:hypothetical protein
MRVTWIGGWGVAPESLRPVAEKYFAHSQHTFLAPTADCIRQVLECGGPLPLSEPPDPSQERQRAGAVQDAGADVLVAWSLGAWRVIEAASRGVEFPGMVLLLAPFVAFPSEAGLGGKCSRTQVKFLRRRLQREPRAALADFYQRGGLGAAPDALPYAMPDLLEGLDRLAEDASPVLREFAARGLPRNWQALVGDDDLLLDAETVRRSLPGCVRVRGAGHAIADLLRASQA